MKCNFCGNTKWLYPTRYNCDVCNASYTDNGKPMQHAPRKHKYPTGVKRAYKNYTICCIQCGKLAQARYKDRKYCSRLCYVNNLTITTRERRHEKQVKELGHILANSVTGVGVLRPKAVRTSQWDKKVTMAEAIRIKYSNLVHLIKVVSTKPRTMHELTELHLKKADGNDWSTSYYSATLTRLFKMGLLGRTVVQITSKTYNRNGHDTYLYHVPKLDTFYAKLFYLTKLEMFSKKGTKACEHAFICE
tara:strand:+ start:349 stop:1089 length:741 start_codon:yes stop_codon:yes gene_type:complete